MERIPEFIGNNLLLVVLFISILSLLLWNLFGSALSGVKQIMPAEVTRLINRENAQLVDLRATSDYANNHILNSINIPESEMEKRAPELESYKKQPLILYCASGLISSRHARSLAQQGFEQVYSIKGGLPSWTSANLPLTKEV